MCPLYAFVQVLFFYSWICVVSATFTHSLTAAFHKCLCIYVDINKYECGGVGGDGDVVTIYSLTNLIFFFVFLLSKSITDLGYSICQ